MEDYEEIAHTGGLIEIKANGALGVRHRTAKAAAWFQICVSLNGIPLGYVPLSGGIGASTPRLPTGAVPVMIASDEEGFFGRQCPSCKGYFRSQSAPDPGTCPYCGLLTSNIGFTTPAQIKFISEFIKVFREVIEKKEDRSINIDQILKNVPENKSHFAYSETRQQTQIKCKSCQVKTDIFGLHGFCHYCGKRNTFDVLIESLSGYQERIDHPRFNEKERDKRDKEWREVITGCVSDFEAFCRDLRDEMLKMPMVAKRRKRLSDLNFQQPIGAANALKEMFDFDLLKNLSADDADFIIKQFNRRHILSHNGGVVDQEYIDKSGDQTVKLGEKIRIKSSNAVTMVKLVRSLGQNFFDNYEESIGAVEAAPTR
jgi:hypothetical protein